MAVPLAVKPLPRQMTPPSTRLRPSALSPQHPPHDTRRSLTAARRSTNENALGLSARPGLADAVDTPLACPRGGARGGAAVVKGPGGQDGWWLLGVARVKLLCPGVLGKLPGSLWGVVGRSGSCHPSPFPLPCGRLHRNSEILQTGGDRLGMECRGGRQLKIARSLSLHKCGCPRVESTGYVSPRSRHTAALAWTPAEAQSHAPDMAGGQNAERVEPEVKRRKGLATFPDTIITPEDEER